jgi:hypothetical protein
MLGNYVKHRELVLYPFWEGYVDRNLEYKPSELGFPGTRDFRGRYRASEGLFFLGYGLGPDLVVEFEVAAIAANLTRDPADSSGMPPVLRQSGLGDVEGQLRWRWQRETERRPEGFLFFETVFPAQKRKLLIGTTDFEYKLGAGLIRGYRWGTMTVRVAAEYSKSEGKVDAGEYAIEYLRRMSRRWRVVAAVEGNQLDEVALIGELQWQLRPRAMLRLNHALGLTPNATDHAPEIGMLFSIGR